MRSLWFYQSLSGLRFMNYRAKIMVVAFAGTHIPLIAIVGFIGWEYADNWQNFVGILAIALAATLGGTAVTLFVLIHLLRPVVETSKALRAYRKSRVIAPLPTGFGDEAGTLMANTVRTLTELETARTQLEDYDADTGLPNRDKLCRVIDKSIADQAHLHVCVVTMNSHGQIATTVEQGAAEDAMKTISTRLQAFLGNRTDLARISPNQFAFLRDRGPEDRDPSITLQTLEDLISRCDGPVTVDNISFQPGLSGGLATSPGDSDAADQLLDYAAAASSFTNTRTLAAAYVPQQRAEALDRFQIEQDLQRAITNDEFELHYQPVVAANEGRAIGAEALIRWNHPTSGLIRPDAFIPVAESSGLIADIGLWVMDAACKQVAEWNQNGDSGLKVAVNLSARQFHDPQLIHHVRDALDAHRLDPSQLEIELTESSLMDDFDLSRATFGRLRDLGVSIAIDDFGTGFASLSYLRRLPFNKLKLDREFVTDIDQTPESQAICSALIALAHGLQLKVLAEGTEKESEIAFLRDMGCQLFQGYYLSKPVPSSEFITAIDPARLVSLLSRTDPQSSRLIA